jgi:hypothetical protein
MTHARTSPFYPQSNGKLERFHKSIKTECIRPKCAETREEAEQSINQYVEYYNTVRLHSAIGYVTPAQMLEGQQQAIFNEREQKLAKAREERRLKRQKIQALAGRGNRSGSSCTEYCPTLSEKEHHSGFRSRNGEPEISHISARRAEVML